MPPPRPNVVWLTPQPQGQIGGINTFLEEIRRAIGPKGLAGMVVRTHTRGALMQAARANIWVMNSYHPGWHLAGRIFGKRVVTAAHFPFWCREKGEDGNPWWKNLVREFFWRWECPCGNEARLRHLIVNMAQALGRTASLLLAHEVVAPSRSLARHLGAPATVIHHPLGQTKKSLPRRLPAARNLLLACRLEDQKGVRDAVRALELLPAGARGYRLRVFGAGPLEGWLKEKARVNHGRIFFGGPVSRKRLRRELTRAFCLLMPSQFLEPAGYSALEAMAAGTPVIFYRDGGLPEMVGRGGVAAARKTPESLARAVLRLARQPKFWRSCSGEARQRAKTMFHPTRAAARWARVLTGQSTRQLP